MRICFVGKLSNVFIRRDYEILKKHFTVDSIQPPKTKLNWSYYSAKVKNKIKNCDISFSWFASFHSSFAVKHSKKYNKKSIVVAGGYDVVDLSEINYGAFNSVKDRMATRYTLKNADIIISISKSNQKELLEKVTPKHNVLIYNGIPIKEYPVGNKEKEDIAITVGNVNWSNLKRKGMETFVKSAIFLEHDKITFIVIGKHVDDSIKHLKNIASKNVEFTGYVTNDLLLEYMQRAKVYVQPSYHEGFGISVAEAMLCKCIPVVTRRFALPEIVGDVGHYVPFEDAEKTALAIKNAMNTSKDLGVRARERIKNNFSMEKREKMLVELIKEGV